MEKWLCLGSLGLSALLSVAFLVDIILGVPFGGLSQIVDILGILAGGLVGYLAWETLREQR